MPKNKSHRSDAVVTRWGRLGGEEEEIAPQVSEEAKNTRNPSGGLSYSSRMQQGPSEVSGFTLFIKIHWEASMEPAPQQVSISEKPGNLNNFEHPECKALELGEGVNSLQASETPETGQQPSPTPTPSPTIPCGTSDHWSNTPPPGPIGEKSNHRSQKPHLDQLEEEREVRNSLERRRVTNDDKEYSPGRGATAELGVQKGDTLELFEAVTDGRKTMPSSPAVPYVQQLPCGFAVFLPQLIAEQISAAECQPYENCIIDVSHSMRNSKHGDLCWSLLRKELKYFQKHSLFNGRPTRVSPTPCESELSGMK
ncbi:hypothetical protein A6R68_19289 [Neotoma lepida]|uniref:Uncharacterized protein n=1 Tax=Neotoma lepida TaxID=56216 RepID=A0A1A6HKW7_NEOLE|nr:hypothetical protein A6R68_19289 [Neotoma lepida]